MRGLCLASGLLLVGGCRFAVPALDPLDAASPRDGDGLDGALGGHDGAPIDDAGFDLAPGPDLALRDLAPAPDLVPDPCGILVNPDNSATPARCVIGAPPVIDGQLGDWAPSLFASNPVSFSTAALNNGANWSGNPAKDDADSSMTFALAWDATYLYVAMKVADDIRAVPATQSFFLVDSIEIYLDGDNDRTDVYGLDDHQFILRADGPGQEYKSGILLGGLPGGVLTAVADGGGAAGYQVEIAVPWTLLGAPPVKIGRTVGFDTLLNDDDDPQVAVQRHWLLWKRGAPLCAGCGGGACYPFCSPKAFVNLQLVGRQ